MFKRSKAKAAPPATGTAMAAEGLSEGKCVEVRQLLDKVCDFAKKWSDHMTSVDLGLLCPRSVNFPTQTAYEASIMTAGFAREALFKYRNKYSEEGFELDDPVFLRILGRFETVYNHVQEHKDICEVNSFSLLEQTTSLKTHLEILKQISQEGGLYKEPGFVPMCTSTLVSVPGVLSPQTPGVHALVIYICKENVIDAMQLMRLYGGSIK